MIIQILKRMAFALTLLLVQVLILDQIHPLGYGAPLLCPLIVITLPLGTSRIAALLWGFGLAVPSQAALFAHATTGAEVTHEDPQIHYWAAFAAIVAAVKLALIGCFGAFLAAVFFKNDNPPKQ